MAAVRVTSRERISDCVACGKDIEGDYTVEVLPTGLRHDGEDHKKAHLLGNIIGVKVDHDCTPGVKRGPGRPRGSTTKPKVVDVSEQTRAALDEPAS